jgi:hypothetical protein
MRLSAEENDVGGLVHAANEVLASNKTTGVVPTYGRTLRDVTDVHGKGKLISVQLCPSKERAPRNPVALFPIIIHKLPFHATPVQVPPLVVGLVVVQVIPLVETADWTVLIPSFPAATHVVPFHASSVC